MKKFVYQVAGFEFVDSVAFGEAWKEAKRIATAYHVAIYRLVIKGDDVINSVYEAIKTGYRLIDTASLYRNEKEVGIAIKRAIDEGIVKREDLFVCSKAPFHLPGYQEVIDMRLDFEK